jgi:GntR family transcriptional regulator
MFNLNPSVTTPLYRQIVDQVRELVLSGRLKSGDELPSVRVVAMDHSVNPMTVSKAYGLLELEGLVVRVRGVGMQIASVPKTATPARQEAQLFPHLREAALAAQRLGITNEEALTQFRAVLAKNNPSTTQGGGNDES